ncbi:MAG: site-specific integrase, partial [Alphaproteobacteria bacterium]
MRRKGYPLQTATFGRKTDARKWAQSVEAAIEERRFKNVAQAKRHTVAELIDRYVETVLPRKPRSARTQRQQLLWWREQLGGLTLADLTTDVIVDCRDRLARRTVPGGGRISPASVNRYLAALSHALTIAVKEYKWLPESPMRDVAKLSESKPRVRYLSDDERAGLLEACRGSSSRHLYVVVVLALST